jgi:hypothetical protein
MRHYLGAEILNKSSPQCYSSAETTSSKAYQPFQNLPASQLFRFITMLWRIMQTGFLSLAIFIQQGTQETDIFMVGENHGQ